MRHAYSAVLIAQRTTHNAQRKIKNPHLKYNSFTEVLRKQFGEKVQRLSLNLGLTCPNIDGTISNNGCIYCSDDALMGKHWHKQQDLQGQIAYGIEYLKERHTARKYLAYFQNGTNTNAPAERLREPFFNALNHTDIVGLIIATRPDCVDDSILQLLAELNTQTYLWVELGLQSPYDHILKSINRGHTAQDFKKTVTKLAENNIKTCAHVILGLPGESKNEMIDGADFVNKLPLNGIKLHNLFISQDTALANMHEAGRYTPMTLTEYAKICVDYLERLRPDITIHRLNAHAPDRLTVAPKWSVNKWDTLNAVHAEILKRNTWQGKKYKAR